MTEGDDIRQDGMEWKVKPVDGVMIKIPLSRTFTYHQHGIRNKFRKACPNFSIISSSYQVSSLVCFSNSAQVQLYVGTVGINFRSDGARRIEIQLLCRQLDAETDRRNKMSGEMSRLPSSSVESLKSLKLVPFVASFSVPNVTMMRGRMNFSGKGKVIESVNFRGLVIKTNDNDDFVTRKRRFGKRMV